MTIITMLYKGNKTQAIFNDIKIFLSFIVFLHTIYTIFNSLVKY